MNEEQANAPESGAGSEETFDTWLSKQDEDVKGLYERHTQGLRGALQSERESRKDLEKQVRDLAGKAEKGSQLQDELTKTADRLAETQTRADFYEAAQAAGIRNMRLAYTVAVQDALFDKRGGVDFETMRKNYPELFGVRAAPTGNAGSGTSSPQPSVNMNTWIRQQAGRS